MRVRSRTARLAAVGLTLALLTAACSDDDGDESSDTTEATETTEGESSSAVAPEDNGGRTEGDGELVIGVLLPQSGDLGQIGPAMIRSAEMAESIINENGGVNGQPVRLIVRDDGGSSNDDLAITATDEFINNDNVDAIVGAAASGTTKAIIDRVTSAGTVECSPSNTGSDLTEWDDQGLYFRTPPPDNLQSLALARVISDRGHSNVAILAQNTDYGTGFIRYLVPAIAETGGEVAAEVTYEQDGTSFDVEIEEIIASEPDAVVLIGYSGDGGLVLSQMIEKSIGPADIDIFVTDGMQSSELYTNVDESDPSVVEGIVGTAPSAAPEGGAAFFPEAFAEFAPEVETPIFSAQTFDCVMALALAAQKTGSDAPYDIALEMINITKGESADATTCSTFEECVAALEADGDINYEGASGSLDFTEWGEPSAGEYAVFEYNAEGADETVDTINIAE